MSMNMTGRVALITAGSAGLGAATARALAALQMRVVINYSQDDTKANLLIQELEQDWQRSQAAAQETSTTRASTTRFQAIKADISAPESAKLLVEGTISAMGRLDLVFSNHGWTKATNFFDVSENVNDQDWRRCFDMNVLSHLHLLHAAQEYLAETEGSFVFTSSTAGVRATGSSLVSYVHCNGVRMRVARADCCWSVGICCYQIGSDPSREMSCCYSRTYNSCQQRMSRADDHGMSFRSTPPTCPDGIVIGMELKLLRGKERSRHPEDQIEKTDNGGGEQCL